MSTHNIIENNKLSQIELSTKIPNRKAEALEKGEAYRGPALNFLTNNTTQWGTTLVGLANLKKDMESDKRELKFKVSGDELKNFQALQESLVETIRRDGEEYGVDTEEDECVGKKILSISENEESGTLTLKIKSMTKFYSEDRVQLKPKEGELLADTLLSNPNTKVSVYFQPNGAYVLDGVAHLSAVVNQLRVLDKGVEFTRMDYTQKIDYLEKSDANLPNYNLIGMNEIDPEKVSFSFTSPMGSLSKQNLLYRFKGANKFLVAQSDYGFTFGIELSDRDDPMSKKQLKIYNPVSDEESNAYYEGYRKLYERLNDHMNAGEYKSIIGKIPKKNTQKGKEIKPKEGYVGDTRRMYDGFSGSCKANTWTEKTLRDGETSYLNKISLKVPTNKEDNSVAVPVFDENGESVDPTLLEDRAYFKDKMVRAVFQVNGVWISKATGFGLMTSVKQLHVKTKGSGGAAAPSSDGAQYITFEEDPEVTTEGLSEEFTKSLDVHG